MARLHHPVYSPTVMEHFTSPRHAERLVHPHAEGWAGPADVPHQVGIQLILLHDRIVRIGFTVHDRTPLRVAAASVLCEWARGQALDTARTFTMEGLAARMGGIPDSQHHEVAEVLQALGRGLDAARALPPKPCETR